MMWAVNDEGRLCVKHAAENIAGVVGASAMRSYASTIDALALV